MMTRRFGTPQGYENWMNMMSDVLAMLRASVPLVPHRRMALAKSLRRMRTSDLHGDYFEFGLYRGSSFSAAQRLARRYRLVPEMRFFGFDSFQGLPEPAGVDVAGEFRKGDYACSRAEVTATLAPALDEDLRELLAFEVGAGAVEEIARKLVEWLRLEPARSEQARAALADLARRRYSWESVAQGVIAAALGQLDDLPEPPDIVPAP